MDSSFRAIDDLQHAQWDESLIITRKKWAEEMLTPIKYEAHMGNMILINFKFD